MTREQLIDAMTDYHVRRIRKIYTTVNGEYFLESWARDVLQWGTGRYRPLADMTTDELFDQYQAMKKEDNT